MDLIAKLNVVYTRIATEFKALRVLISGSATGNTSALTTTADNLVGAVNENKAAIDAVSAASGVVSVNGANGTVVIGTDEVAEGSSNLYFTEARSDARVQNAIGSSATPSSTELASTQDLVDHAQQVKDDVLGGASAAYDTLQELAGEIQANDTDITSILSNQTKRVAVDSVQAFTSIEKQQGRDNLEVYSTSEIGNIATADFVTTFEGALV